MCGTDKPKETNDRVISDLNQRSPTATHNKLTIHSGKKEKRKKKHDTFPKNIPGRGPQFHYPALVRRTYAGFYISHYSNNWLHLFS